MKLSLSPDLAASLPEPDKDGIVRVTAGVKLSPDGEVRLVELNDMPVENGPENDEPEGKADEIPDAGAMAEELYGTQRP